jgi:hypothetical protein
MKENKKNKDGIGIYERKAGFGYLKDWCHHSKASDFIEVTDWVNGEGFDVLVDGGRRERFSLTWGEYSLLKRIVKRIDKV